MEYESKQDCLPVKNILLRNYQIRLLEEAKSGNTILYLPAGSGKTLIAIHLLHSKTEEITGSFSNGAKRAFFVGTTKVLVHQLFQNIRIHTNFKTGIFTGEMDVCNWNKEKWVAQFEKYHVIVLTGEILRQLLIFDIIKPANISLVVLDECHHATAEHPYNLLLQALHNVDSSETPLLLGLTSVLLNCTPKKENILAIIQDLENSFRGKIITESELQEIMSFSAKPNEKILFYKANVKTPIFELVYELYNAACKIIDKMTLQFSECIPTEGIPFKTKSKARRIKNMLVLSKQHFEEFGLFGGTLSALLFIIAIEKYRLLSSDPKEVQALIYARTELNKVRHIVKKAIGEEETAASIIKFSSPKVQQLIHILKESNRAAGNNQISTLIFVHQRSTAILLAFLLRRLNALDSDFSFIKADFSIGFSVFEKESDFLMFHGDDHIKKFASQSLNVLVTTNVLEEGIDISVCNVVVSFDFPLGYSSYFQSRGRARDKKSSYYVFIKDDEVDNKLSTLKTFSDLEKNLHQVLSEDYESVDVSENESETIHLTLKSRSCIIDGTTAIKVVHRYCEKLPQDIYSLLSPLSWYVKKSSGFKQGFIKLPINCPLRNVIEGEERPVVKLAKRNVFLITLKLLYEMGELDDDFNPKSVESEIKHFENLFPHLKKENIEPHLPQPGTKKRKQLYKVKFAESLSNCLPQAGVKAYLHVMDLTVVFDKPELKRKIAIYEILKNPVSFAIISSKKLDKICQFPLFLDMGEINCDLLVNYDEMVFTESEINDIKMCHFAIFQKVTGILKNFHVFDNRNKEHSFFIVPVEKNEEDRFVLNWDVIRCDFCTNNQGALARYNPSANKRANLNQSTGRTNFTDHTDSKETSGSLVPVDCVGGMLLLGMNRDENNRTQEFVLTETDYKYFIVIPTHRALHPPTRYIVSKVCHDLTPLSPFPNTAFSDFVSYYRDKYSTEITNTKQPLLKVHPLFSCSNFNKPRNRSDRLSRKKVKELEELFIPELCDIIPFDRKFYLKALLIPTVLNRIYHIYCIEEFRRKIVSETGLGLCELPENTSWKPLKVDDALRNNEDEDGNTSPGDLTTKNFKLELPLSQLRDASEKKDFLNPERNLYEISPCDVELFVKSIKEMDAMTDTQQKQFLENDEIIKLINTPIDSSPNLSLLKGSREKSGPDLALLVEASTSKSAHDIVNYERLEILGDSFLKFAATLFLFRYCTQNEGVLTILKSKMVGNRNLMYCGLAKNIQDVINVTDFAPLSEWNPPLLNVPERFVNGIIDRNVDTAVLYGFEFSPEEQFSGILSESTLKKNEEILENYEETFEMPRNFLLAYKTVEDKTISDCVEAFIGAYLLCLGLPGAFEFLFWLGIIPKPEGSYAELMTKPYEPSVWSSEGDAAIMEILRKVFYSDLENVLGYSFKNKALLLEALTHPSYSNNRITNCYQRLELLGDAILDFLITAYIYEKCGDLTPGQVTDIRSALVNNITFACLVVRFEFHKYLLAFSAPLKKAIENFVTFQVGRNHLIDDNVRTLMEESDCLLAEAVQVPKALGDVFESLAGAIFLDSGNSLETVWKVYYRLMERELCEFTKTVPKTAVRLLQEICGDKPYYETKVIKGGTKVSCTVYYENQEITAHGIGQNKKEGKRSAAKLCLKKIFQLKKKETEFYTL